MSNDKPLKRYGPVDVQGYNLTGVMEEVSGGSYIDEDELRKRLNEMLSHPCDAGVQAALNRVLKLIDTPNW